MLHYLIKMLYLKERFFSIKDETDTEELANYIQNYKQREFNARHNKEVDYMLKDDIFKVFMLDAISLFKNDLNKISMLSSYYDDINEKFSESLENGILELSKNLDDKVNFYLNGLYDENSSIDSEIAYFTNLFSSMFFQNSVDLKLINNAKHKKYFSTIELKKLFFYIFKFLINAKSYIDFKDRLSIIISCSNDSEYYRILIDIDCSVYNHKKLNELFNLIKDVFKNSDINLDLKLVENVKLNLVLRS